MLQSENSKISFIDFGYFSVLIMRVDYGLVFDFPHARLTFVGTLFELLVVRRLLDDVQNSVCQLQI